MTLEALLRFVAKQLDQANVVHTCYEAGAFGYHLHRKLTEMGAMNVVVQPQDWDERGKRVKTDRLDALALCQRLDRYVRGNRKAFSVVRVPTQEQERERAMSRQRSQLVRERTRIQAMGRSLLATQGIHVNGRWWRGRTWAGVQEQAPQWVLERLAVFIRLLEPLECEEAALSEAIKEVGKAAPVLPKGVGPLTFEVLRREVGDWSRFNNRRQVSSYTGLCPREHSSGGKRRGGSVNKSGNSRVRAMLVEMTWRLIRWQPEYHALRKELSALVARMEVEQAEAAFRLAEDRYLGGLDPFLNVSDAQRRLLDSRSRLLEVRRLRLDVRIDLHLALGGAFEVPEADVLESRKVSTP